MEKLSTKFSSKLVKECEEELNRIVADCVEASHKLKDAHDAALVQLTIHPEYIDDGDFENKFYSMLAANNLSWTTKISPYRVARKTAMWTGWLAYIYDPESCPA